MKKVRIMNIIGLIIIIFLSICKAFFSEQFSYITTGLGGLICVFTGFALAFYRPKKDT